MSRCNQSKEQSILQHGLSVRDYVFDLINILNGNKPKYNWRLPEWFLNNKDFFLKNILDKNTIEQYTIFHDCGKPYCYNEDDTGIHFNSHAEISYNIWMEISPKNEQVGKLIKMDMDIHTLKSKDIKEFSSRKESATLLLVGLAEIHSNAVMFGGITSNSFKIKLKQIDRKGKAICAAIA